MLPLLSAAVLLAPSADPGPWPDPVECKKLAKSGDGVFHAVSTVPPAPARGRAMPGPDDARYQITHTDLKTGTMRTVVAGGHGMTMSPPMGIDREYHRAVGISAVAADGERLYVLVIRADETVMVVGPDPKPKFEEFEQRLMVFRAADGKMEQNLPLPEKTPRLGNLFADRIDARDILFVTKTGVRIGVEDKPHATFTRKDGKLEAAVK